jgi:hypothetical protein
MAITAVIDTKKTPMELTVTSDKRKITLTATVAGETATATATFEPIITDTSGRVWTKKSDNGTTAIYTG